MTPARTAITAVGLLAALGGVVLMLARGNNDWFFLCAVGFGLVLLGTLTGGRRPASAPREPAPLAAPPLRPATSPPPPVPPPRPATRAPEPAKVAAERAERAERAEPAKPPAPPKAPSPTLATSAISPPAPAAAPPEPERARPGPEPKATPAARPAPVVLEADRTSLPEPEAPSAGTLLRDRASQLPGAPAAVAAAAAGAVGAVVMVRRLLRR